MMMMTMMMMMMIMMPWHRKIKRPFAHVGKRYWQILIKLRLRLRFRDFGGGSWPWNWNWTELNLFGKKSRSAMEKKTRERKCGARNFFLKKEEKEKDEKKNKRGCCTTKRIVSRRSFEKQRTSFIRNFSHLEKKKKSLNFKIVRLWRNERKLRILWWSRQTKLLIKLDNGNSDG